MIEKKIGKIKKVSFGYGGYQDAMFGVSFTLGSDSDSWGTGDFWGTWSQGPQQGAKWTSDDQLHIFGATTKRIIELCDEAKVKDISELKDVPVEVTFNDMKLHGWRILKEVI